MVTAGVMNNIRVLVTHRLTQSRPPTPVAAPEDDIFSAASRGDLNAVRTMLQSDPALLDERDEMDSQPLHRALENGRREMARYLIAMGADLNAPDVTGSTPLHLAVLGSAEPIVALLLDRGADPYARNRYGMTPLKLAVMYGRENTADRIRAAHKML